MKKQLVVIGALFVSAIAGNAVAGEIYSVDCTSSTIVFNFSEDVAIADGTVTGIQVGQSRGTMDGYLTSGSTLAQT